MKTTLTTIILSSALLLNTGCTLGIPSLTDSKSTQSNDNNTTEEPSYIEKKISRIFDKVDEVITRKIDEQDAKNEAKERDFDRKTDESIEKFINKI